MEMYYLSSVQRHCIECEENAMAASGQATEGRQLPMQRLIIQGRERDLHIIALLIPRHHEVDFSLRRISNCNRESPPKQLEIDHIFQIVPGIRRVRSK